MAKWKNKKGVLEAWCPMTEPHPQPERCIHECVCHSYLDYQSDDLDPCLAKKCEHDTRTHTPAAPATEYTIEQIAEIDNRIRKECKAERDQVLDAAIAILKDGIVWMPEFTVPRMKEGKIDALEWAIEKLESLRGGGAP